LSSKIVLHTAEIQRSIAGFDQNMAKLLDAKINVSTLKYSIDPEILSRRGIGSRITAVRNSINEVENKIKQVKTFTSTSINQYTTVQSRLDKKAAEIRDNWYKGTKHPASDLYELYNNTIGRYEDLLHALQYSAGAGILHLLGFKFSNVDDVLRRFEMADDVLLGKAKLPIGKAIKGIENSKLNFLARLMINKRAFIGKYKDLSLAELIYKKFTRLLPTDILGLSNSVGKFKYDFRQAGSTLKGMFGAVKSNAGSILKSSLNVGKSNALLAVGITAVAESIGAGIKITENYALYGGDIEKLKEENAKTVGTAIYKTGVVSATSVGGAVIGGALGSFLGPIGTVAGASIGGFVGSWVGDKIASNTPAWVDKTALHFKDGIHTMVDGVASGVSKVTEGFNTVKNHASNLLNGSKKLLGALSFGN
jgi:hypothetical protein